MRLPSIRLMLIDPHASFSEVLAYYLRKEEPDLSVIGTATEANDGMRMILEKKPDVVVLETELPGRGAFDLVSDLRKKLKGTKIVFLTGFQSDVFIKQALELDARGYLLKTEPVDFVIQSLKRVATGEYCYSKTIEERIKSDPDRNQIMFRSEGHLSSLTPRQLEVLRHLSKGLSVKEVAKQMLISSKSVDSHKYRIMHKLDIHDRVSLARYAIREGLLLP